MLLGMKRILAEASGLFLAGAMICTSFVATAQTSGSQPHPNPAAQSEARPVHKATGPFDVKIAPQKPDNPQAEAAGLGRMSLDKQYHGDLEAGSQGEMLSILDRATSSGGYVAMERVTGKLQGRSGSFALQHNATMDHGAPQLNIIVVPGSGTGELAGISGSMTIRIEPGGHHFYDFEYTLPASQ